MGRSATAVAAALCMVLFAGEAGAQYFGRNKVQRAKLEFKLLQTEHFDIYYYAEEEAATRHAARMAERWYSRFSRLFEHSFTHRQPLVLYASHPNFAQTNLTAGSPGEGTGGFTERTRSRIAMPFAAGLGETDHVLGHEIAHAFQIDVAKRARRDAFALPGWVIEGMAEYLSLGPSNANTTMWLRDAALHDRLPTLAQLGDSRYFPYRYGHAFWSYLGARFGDAVMGRVLRSKVRGVLERIEEATGVDRDELTRDWHQSVRTAVDVEATGERAAAQARNSGDNARIHVGPALSPDGRRLVFLSERDRLSMDLYLADAVTGEVLLKVISTAADPHFDSLQYINSAGAWDHEGRRFAFTALRGGAAVLVVVDTSTAPLEREEIVLAGIDEAYTPSWSPDGTRLVFSALQGGLSNLFVFDLDARSLRPLTDDVFADLHPSWSADGAAIAFATDRFTSSLDRLQFGSLRIAILDLATGSVRDLVDDGPGVKQVNPQWSADGQSVYYVSDRGGVSNVFVTEVATADTRQITQAASGVSGITASSPALAVASRAGTMAFSVYRNGRFEIETLTPQELPTPNPANPDAAVAQSTSVVTAMLADSATGLPSSSDFTTLNYDDRLRLESISQPYVGASTGNGFGGVLRTTVGATFGDVLRDRQLQTAVQLGTRLDDFALQVAYANRRDRWNWGVGAGFMPSRFYGARRALAQEGGVLTREISHLRYLDQWGGVSARYNVTASRRIEIGSGLRRTGVTWQTITRTIDVADGSTINRALSQTPAGRPLYVADAHVAVVADTAVFGATSPVLGHRLRLEVEPAFGAATYADIRVDARRYFMPVRPITIAVRAEHVGRFGPDAADPRLVPLVAGLESLVRGYDLRTFAIDTCGRTATECSLVDALRGSRFALANIEVRAPLAGLLSGNLDYGRIPIEAIAYVDAGYLWTHAARGSRFRSAGFGGRANLGGLVVEVSAARPLDRDTSGWTASILLRPGW